MSPFEYNILRFIITLDNMLVALIPWMKALAVAVTLAAAALLVHRISHGRARSVK